MHASGIGQALLVHKDGARLKTFLNKAQFEKFKANSVPESNFLKTHLSKIRTNGFVADTEEKNTGRRCIAALVFDFKGETIAGTSVAGPTNWVDLARLQELVSPVMNAIRDLSFAIEAKHPPIPINS